MSAATIDTIARMVESLPESTQEKVAAHLREYIEDLRDDAQWAETFWNTQPELTTLAREAKAAYGQGLGRPMDYDRL